MILSINEKFNFLNYLMNRRSSGAAPPYSSPIFLTSLQTCRSTSLPIIKKKRPL
ncbi:hypothetical protein HOLDEFILI_03004 [Holdemania filiformis DSM 12042]|uniref:Uncharacterized protein n=1 Tax=Holdemania filiformis DSM 12042 TaxID=545696 RepID=B9YAZ7_9FIRM|nr:hypothetical protein HOLDEFILI_03004 [Holdemania filiformis DSM 12042]